MNLTKSEKLTILAIKLILVLIIFYTYLKLNKINELFGIVELLVGILIVGVVDFALITHFIKNKEVTIQYYYPEREIIKFIEINSIDEAKLLTNSVIYATEEETRKNCHLREGEFFWFEIIGCKIIENGVFLGTVKDIYRYPSSDYLLIETNEKLLKKTKVSTFLIPYVDRYIKNVNIEEKEIFTQNGLLLLESL